MFGYFKRRAIKRALKELEVPKALPMGRKEFEIWSDRIIRIAQIPGATARVQKFALADQLLHLKPTQDFECDGYFAKILRKFAVNDIAWDVRQELKDIQKAQYNLKTNDEKILDKPTIQVAAGDMGQEIS